jgi:hypothetical protein
MGPSSAEIVESLIRTGCEGMLGGRGERGGLNRVSAGLSVNCCSDCCSGTESSDGSGAEGLRVAGALGSFDSSSGIPSAAKSESFRGGAGAEGEIVALSAIGIGIGARAEVPCRMRVGAVEPDSSVFAGPRPPRSPLPLPFPRPGSLPPAAAFAVWAAFLFFRSIDIGWPGRMWARAHL